MQHIHFFHHQALPVPGSSAKPVSYPVCEWRGPKGHASDDALHPLNRFVCSWLTSDVSTVERCQEVLDAMGQIESGQHVQWFADGDAFNVDFSANGVQFNQSNVGPEDATWWNLAEAKFSSDVVQALLKSWLVFLKSALAF